MSVCLSVRTCMYIFQDCVNMRLSTKRSESDNKIQVYKNVFIKVLKLFFWKTSKKLYRSCFTYFAQSLHTFYLLIDCINIKRQPIIHFQVAFATIQTRHSFKLKNDHFLLYFCLFSPLIFSHIFQNNAQPRPNGVNFTIRPNKRYIWFQLIRN